MDFMAIFRAPGYLFGPPAMFMCLAALALCAWASVRPGRSAARRALFLALTPLAIALIGIVAGFVYLAIVGHLEALAGPEGPQAWAITGNMSLFGVLLSALPTLWAALLFVRRRRAMA